MNTLALAVPTGWPHALTRSAGLLLGSLLLVGSLLLDIASGPAQLTLTQVVHSLLHGEGSDGVIVWQIRLPVALMALAVGAALGVSGLIMQTVLHNPLACSYTLGISAGAGFGAALFIVAGSSLGLAEAWGLPLSALVFAFVAGSAVLLIGRQRGGNAESYVLAGIALLFLFQALLSLLQYLAAPDALAQIVFWLFGSLYKSGWHAVGLMWLTLLLSTLLLARDAWRFTALSLSDERATSLGIAVARLRWRALALVSLLTGVAVAFVGTIGFVGLIAPHMARMLLGEDHRFLIPGAALYGALLLSLASVLGKWLSPGGLIPIGIVTALIGLPFFLLLILRSKGGQ
jgi:iron complex transport system permease protein